MFDGDANEGMGEGSLTQGGFSQWLYLSKAYGNMEDSE